MKKKQEKLGFKAFLKKHKKGLIAMLVIVLVIAVVAISLDLREKHKWKKHHVEPYHYEFVENEDFEIIRGRILETLKDPNVDVSEYVKDVDENGKFRSVQYDSKEKDRWYPLDHLERTAKMQIAYNSEGNPHFHDPEVKAAVERAMRFWAQSDLKCDWNWWYNSVGVGKYIPDILLFGVDGLDEASKTKLLTDIKGTLLQNEMLFNGAVEREVDSSGGNLTDQAISTLKVAVIEKDGSTMKWVTKLLERELHPFPSYNLNRMHADCTGVKEDGSFQQHDQLIYFGGYGEVFADGLNLYIRFTHDTQFALNNEALNLYADFLLDGMQYMTRNGYREISASGRGISRVDALKGIGPQVKDGAEILLQYGDIERKAELENMLRTRFSDEKDPGAGGHHYYYESDFQIINNENYMASVRSASNHTRIYEYLNGENPFAYYTGLGATFFYVDGDEYYNLLPLYDWNKIPGTTTRQGYIPYYNQEIAYGKYGTTNYISGVSNGKIGMSFMRLRNNGVRGRKAYFLFEDGMVCLGTALSTYHKEPLLTCVNQTNFKDNAVVGGEPLKLGETKQGAFPYIYHNQIGYIVDSTVKKGDRYVPENEVVVSAEHRDGDWKTINERFSKNKPVSGDCFTISIPHEKNKASYAYTVLPNVTQQETEAYVENPYLEVLENSKKVQAVYHNRADVLQAVFHKGGDLQLPNGTTISVNKACVLMLEPENGSLKLTAASYNGREKKVKITVNGKTQTVELSKKSQSWNF